MERLKEFRVNKKMTQKVIADKMGITLSMYEKVEHGAANASAGFMRRLADAFPDADINYIFFNGNSNKIAEASGEEAS